jgi:hypothetical protein
MKGVGVSNAPDLFLGLVTHPTSAFNRDNQARKSLEQVSLALSKHGLRVECFVSDRNDYSAADFPITQESLLKAAVAQTDLERQWRDFVDARSGTTAAKRVRSYCMYLAMRGKRTLAALRGNGSPAARAYQRLINIDLSHLRVLTEGINSRARAIVILEDDASMPTEAHLKDFAQILMMAIESDIDFINLSQSISDPELGIEAIVNRGRTIEKSQLMDVHGSRVIELDTPITNTVCANYYSNSFARKFREHISPPNLTPVKPIDWRLNEVMLANPKTRTWWVQPGLFIQGSMHSNPD